MKELFICDTPYQTLNVLNIVYHNMDAEKDQSTVERDLYIINQFKSAPALKDRIEKKGIFTHVYMLSRDETKFLKVGIKRHIKMSLDFLGPRRFLAKRFSKYSIKDIDYEHYDYVYASGAFSTVAAILKLNPKARFIMYEDGLGSYSGDYIVISSGGKFNKIFCDLFHVGSYVCKPIKLLVNNVEICHCTSVKKEDIQPLPHFDKEFVEYCNDIFDCNASEGNNIIWLSQPLDCHAGAMETRDLIKDSLLAYKDHITVRMHPRDLEINYYEDFNIDKGNDLWELSILNKDLDKLALVGAYSSAQITPKILFDMEPSLVFTYAMNSMTDEVVKESIGRKIDEIREIYKAPEKIYTPQNKEELMSIIQKLTQ